VAERESTNRPICANWIDEAKGWRCCLNAEHLGPCAPDTRAWPGRDLSHHATLPDLIALLERKRAAAQVIADNDAADADTRAQARDWILGLDGLHRMFTCTAMFSSPAFTAAEAHQLVLHWNRLFEVLAGEVRAGLHVMGAGDGA
jgi:hypothetical protein